ncbi:hypothetical protein, partial [Turicimonas muris]
CWMSSQQLTTSLWTSRASVGKKIRRGLTAFSGCIAVGKSKLNMNRFLMNIFKDRTDGLFRAKRFFLQQNTVKICELILFAGFPVFFMLLGERAK